MKIAICENNKIMLDIVCEKVLEYQCGEEIKVDTYSTGSSLIQAAKDQIKEPYDIVLMDICLTDSDGGEEIPDGIDVVRAIKSLTPTTLAVYMSSYSGFYTNLVQAEPFAFLHKPIGTEELFRVLDDCRKRLDILKHKYYSYKFGKREVKINLNDVLFFYSRHRTVHYRLSDGTDEYFYEKLDNVESDLNNMGAFFIRVNKSYIINKIYIKDAYLDHLRIGEQKINVTDNYKEAYRIYLIRDRLF